MKKINTVNKIVKPETEILQSETVEDINTIDNELEEIKNLYSENDLECSVYTKGNYNKKEFCTKYDHVPDPIEIKTEFGGGTFFLYFKKRNNAGQFENIRATTLNIIQDKTNPGAIEIKKTDNTNDVLDTLKKFKDTGLIGGNNNTNNSGTELMQMMLQQQAQTFQLVLALINQKADQKENPLMKILLEKSLEKTNPMEQIKSFVDIQKLITGSSKTVQGGSFWDSLGASLPGLLSMIQQGGGNSQTAENPQLLAYLKKMNSDIEQMKKDLYQDEDENVNEIQNESMEVIKSDEQINFEIQQQKLKEEEEKQMKFLIEHIKNLPEEKKIEVLKGYIDVQGVEPVKKWCIENEVTNENEFNSYLEKLKLNLPIVK